jgi:crossover junction endodeoxyribonuclease RusA
MGAPLMRRVVFDVHGVPAPQGSKTVARTKSGRSFVRDDNPATAPWRSAVAAAAADATEGEPLTGPVQLDVVFLFPRPRSHYRTNGQLKPSAPFHCPKRPDLDKLLRALGDALSGVALVDDAQIVAVRASKSYGPARAVIDLSEVAP